MNLLQTSRLRSSGPKLQGFKLRTAKPSHHGEHWKSKDDVILLEDGRERCNPVTAGGKKEYMFRRFLLWLRQYSPKAKAHLCCNCRGVLEFEDSTFEHEALRGKDIDERLYNSKGQPINGASHSYCNRKRASQRLPIWHGTLNVRQITLTAEQFFYLTGKRCFCGTRKSSLSSCCPNCQTKLSPQLRMDLYQLTEVNHYADALRETERMLG